MVKSEDVFGRRGNPPRFPSHSIVTDQPLAGQVVTERIPGTRYFVQYEPSRAHQITASMRAAWQIEAENVLMSGEANHIYAMIGSPTEDDLPTPDDMIADLLNDTEEE